MYYFVVVVIVDVLLLCCVVDVVLQKRSKENAPAHITYTRRRSSNHEARPLFRLFNLIYGHFDN